MKCICGKEFKPKRKEQLWYITNMIANPIKKEQRYCSQVCATREKRKKFDFGKVRVGYLYVPYQFR